VQTNVFLKNRLVGWEFFFLFFFTEPAGPGSLWSTYEVGGGFGPVILPSILHGSLTNTRIVNSSGIQQNTLSNHDLGL